MRWHSIALTLVIVALLGAGAWWGWQAYPEWFGRAPIDVIEVTEQEAQAGMETAPPQATETGDALASAEETLPPDREEIEQPVPKEPALSPEEAEVARLLAAAEADLKVRRLTSPVGNNAWDKYQRVLELEPTNPEAVKGIGRVIESYRELFGAAVEQEDFDKAAGYLAKIRELHPDSPVLEEGERRLEATKQVRAERLVEIERQRQAEEAARQAALERQRIAKVIEGHWKAFEAALGEENLSDAADILAQVRALHPEEPGLAAGERRLESLRAELERQRAEAIQAHWTAFESALEAEDLDGAARILARARALNPEESGLAAGERRLEAGRQKLLERQRQEALEREFAGEMVAIPGGTFRMGDLSGEGRRRERPVHSVTVPGFEMGKYEVTYAQWHACTADGGCRVIPDRSGRRWNKRPVINVSWDEVQGFIRWLNSKTGGKFRLPTEAEWEYAARAGSTTKYSWGNSIGSNRANCDGCGSRWDYYQTAPVGSFTANAWGLHDMHGNVLEWVQDCWNKNYKGAPSDGRAWMSGKCSRRVLRGGSGYAAPRDLRSACRSGLTYAGRGAGIGFRLVQDK